MFCLSWPTEIQYIKTWGHNYLPQGSEFATMPKTEKRKKCNNDKKMECRLQKLTVSMTPGTTAPIHSMLLLVFGQFSNAQPRLWHSIHGQVTGTFPNKTRFQPTKTQTREQSKRKISTRVLKRPTATHTCFITMTTPHRDSKRKCGRRQCDFAWLGLAKFGL